ncbi:hypothetical protein [Bradyrhizobium sp. SZCCHNPS1003]|uniref:hypothetical protein n=1 Tax=Bradyrhizobium sp. SZCCHNPS1003 TaxID=3057330 RepID=UPI0028E6D974|nr:hypothetical protein [Bradyrhizobium sp. SZCCHNPS1003]
MSLLFSLLGMIPGLANGFLTWLNKKTDSDLEKYKTAVGSDTTLNVEDIRAKVEIAKMMNQQRSEDREHWFTAWMVPAAFGVFLSHAAAVVFDSMPLLGHEIGTWHVAELPGQYASMQNNVILTVCGIGGVSAFKKIFSR